MKTYAKEFGKAFIFKSIRPGIKEFFMKAGYEDVPYEMFGGIFYISAALTYILYLVFIYPLLQEYSVITVVVSTFLSWVIIQLSVLSVIAAYIYFSITIKIYKRTKEIERILPEYLQIVSSNLKGGLSFEKSLWNAINPEFSIVAREITIVSKKVMTGNDLTDALEEFTEKYESPLLKRSFDLIIGEVESGGQIAFIVDKVIENIRKTKQLKEEMTASTLSYMIFIGAIVIVISPGLFALSYQLLTIMSDFALQIAASTQGASMPIEIGAGTMDVAAYRTFSILALIVTAFFSSMIISIIQSGDIRGGIKYIPAFIISSMFFYFIFSVALGVLFGKMI